MVDAATGAALGGRRTSPRHSKCRPSSGEAATTVPLHGTAETHLLLLPLQDGVQVLVQVLVRGLQRAVGSVPLADLPPSLTLVRKLRNG